MASYQQFFYHVDVGVNSGDIGPTKHAQIAKATLNLQLLKEVLIATCCGGYNISEAPEIALVIPSVARASDFTSHVQKALAERGLDATVTLKDDIRYYTFTEEQLAHVADATRVENLTEAYRAVDRMCAYGISDELNKDVVKELPTEENADASTGGLEERAAGKLTYAKDFPPHQIGELAALNVTEYTKFKNAKGAQIEPLMKDLFNALDHLSKETNTNAAVTLMIKQGLLWVGKKMSAEFDKIPWGGNLTVWLGTVIASAGGMAVIGPVVGAIVIVFAILWLLLKGATNGLILFNAQATPISVVSDYIINGVRTSVPISIQGCDPHADGKPQDYPYGLFIYDKDGISLYGSTVGISFNHLGSKSYFALGLDCPNVQRNAVAAVLGDYPAKAAEKVDETADAEASLKLPDNTIVTIRRADSYGTVNYCIGTVV